MTDYIVSARKYRPKSFNTLIGQDNIAKTLLNSIRRGQLAHAYLFCGPRGVGKTTTARIFAKMINCLSPLEDGEPCGHCESCLSFEEGSSYCIQELDAASNNSVDDIKELIDKVRTPPQVGKYSVYIIDEVHMLSQAAFNAFLKTLEEPPEHAIFILATTEKHKILPTILSRCQTYDFNRISVDNIVRNLRDIASKEDVSIDDESLHVIAIKADGAMRDALTIFDQTVAFCGTDVKYADVIRNLNVLDYEYSFSLVDNFLVGDYATAFRTFDEILAKGFNALHFVTSLSSHLRNLIVAKVGGIDSLLELADSVKDRYRQQALSCSEKFLFEALGSTTACEQGYRTAVNPRLHIEFCLMKLSLLNRAPSTVAAAPAAVQATQAAQDQPATVQTAQAVTAQTQPAAVQATQATQAAQEAAQTVQTTTVQTQPVAVQAQPTATQAAQAATVQTQPEAAQAATAQTQPEEAQAQPAMAPSAEKPQIKLPRISLGLSISNIEKSEKKTVSEEPLASEDVPMPDDEQLRKAWQALCEISKPNQRLYNALVSAELTLGEDNGLRTVEFELANSSLKDWFDEKLSRIENKFRELLGNPKAKILTRTSSDDSLAKHIVVSDADKAREMMEQNPAVKELITDLKLEIK